MAATIKETLLLLLLLTSLKLLLIPSYTSTDFEVHRNWLAITYNLPYRQWYYDSTSEWTLDYPPLFAWFEYVLASIASLIDPTIVTLSASPFKTHTVLLYQRLTVIVSDLVLYGGVMHYITSTQSYRAFESPDDVQTAAKQTQQNAGSSTAPLLILFLTCAHPALLIVDHIHFQYNGMLLGILIFSISYIHRQKYIHSAFAFAILLMFKHIFLYTAPVYFVYLLKTYCVDPARRTSSIAADDLKSPKHAATARFQPTVFATQIAKLGIVVVTVFAVALLPFAADYKQLLARLFPFQRGLSHAYWAPNVWALYNTADRLLVTLIRRLNPSMGAKLTASASTTAGLVSDITHVILPTIRPNMTAALTVISMLPALYILYQHARPTVFHATLIYCSLCSFMLGWHVHEKAILLALLPKALQACDTVKDARQFLFLSLTASISIFPLLFTVTETPTKYLLTATYHLLAYVLLTWYHTQQQSARRIAFSGLFQAVNKQTRVQSTLEQYYLHGLLPLLVVCNVICPVLLPQLQFAPLLLVSVYTAVGITYSWYRSYQNMQVAVEL